MVKWIAVLSDTLSGPALVVALLGAGAFFTYRFRAVQVTAFVESVRVMAVSGTATTHGITPFQAFATGLASRVGTGNIAGVAVALSAGGPGAIFWMWVTALVGMASAFGESTLAQLFKVPHGPHSYRGGPAYYIRDGLKQKWLGQLFAVSLIFAFGFALNTVQANSIADAFNTSFGWSKTAVGIGLVFITIPIISGGIRRIALTAQFVVPLMALIYIGLSAYVVIVNFSAVPDVLATIFRHAFGLEQAAGGVAGYAVSQAVMMGVRRGLFSNEAGMGSAPNAAAVASARHPVQQGLLQMLGVCLDTLVICTGTAALIMLSGVYEAGNGLLGASLTQRAMAVHVGEWGNSYMAITLFFLAYSSVLGNCAYAEVNVDFLTKHPAAIYVFRLVVVAAVMSGAVSSLPLVWSLADISTALMAFINVAAVVLLSRFVFRAWRDYKQQREDGVRTPVFHRETLGDLGRHLHPDVWGRTEKEREPNTARTYSGPLRNERAYD
ncbi:sodium:alanine symporter family protein [Robbsia sp. KACC 23696]|uniref:alanine/glycine:cation symporter family protein n=1 Tax=Robbsia sp. KACC 23696 TaxID=3149231 RepID=UPI00325BF7F2